MSIEKDKIGEIYLEDKTLYGIQTANSCQFNNKKCITQVIDLDYRA